MNEPNVYKVRGMKKEKWGNVYLILSCVYLWVFANVSVWLFECVERCLIQWGRIWVMFLLPYSFVWYVHTEEWIINIKLHKSYFTYCKREKPFFSSFSLPLSISPAILLYHFSLSLFSITLLYHSSLSLFSIITFLYRFSLSLFSITLLYHFSLSLFSITLLYHSSLSLFSITLLYHSHLI